MTDKIKFQGLTLDARDYASQGNAILGIRDSGKCEAAEQMVKEDAEKWVDDLEHKVKNRFPWGWGESMPGYVKAQKKGQEDFFYKPMCAGCDRMPQIEGDENVI